MSSKYLSDKEINDLLANLDELEDESEEELGMEAYICLEHTKSSVITCFNCIE